MKTIRSIILLCVALLVVLIGCFCFSGLPTESQLQSTISAHQQTLSGLTASLRTDGYHFSERRRESSPDMRRFGIPPTVDGGELHDSGFSPEQIAAAGTAVSFRIALRPEPVLGTPWLNGHYLYDPSGKLIVGRAEKTFSGL